MIFLDFDGVLFDTVREAYAIALIASEKCNTLEEIDYNTDHYQKFRKLRYLISPAWNYKYLLEELEKQQDFAKLKSVFLEKINDASKIDYKKFEEEFFKTRNRLKKQCYEKWFRLNIPFPFLSEIEFLFHNYKEAVYIVTTKDKSTVLKLLEFENISFSEDKIFDKNDYEKHGNKKSILKLLNKNKEKSIFIDDSDRHIKDCSDIEKLVCFQPDWGYIGLDSNAVNQKIILEEINSLIGR